MVDVAKINRELSQLDGALRGGRVSLVQFRAERRRILLDFDERASTTQPGETHRNETTLVDPPVEEAPTSTSSDAAAESDRSAKPVGLVAIALVAATVAGAALWWFFVRVPAGELAPPAAGPASVQSKSDLPQDVASVLIQSTWGETDLDAFLVRWHRLSPESVRAAADDPRIWLLRGETEQRLRNAREAESVDPTDAARARTQKLEQIQNAVRAP